MITSQIKTATRNRDLFRYDEVFFTDGQGQYQKALAEKYPTKEAFYRAQADETRNAFADIDVNFAGRTAVREKLYEIGVKVFSKVEQALNLYDPIPQMFHTATYGIGEQPEIHEVSGGRVYERSYGAYARMSRLTQTTYTLTPYGFAIHLAEPLETLQSGRITAADVSFAIAKEVLARRIRFGYDTYIAALGTDANQTVNESGALTDTNVKLAIRKVNKLADVTSCTLVGAYVDLVQVADFNTVTDMWGLFPESLKEEVARRGVIGQYSGAMILPIKYWTDDRYAYEPFPSGSVFAVSNEMGWNEFANFGSARTDSWISPEDGMVHWLYDFKIGAAVWKIKYLFRIYGITNPY